MSRSLLAALLLALPCGCTVTAVSAGDGSSSDNACSDTAPCQEGQRCRSGVCQTLNGELEAVLISATPPSDSDLPRLSLVTHWDGVPTQGGDKDLVLPEPVTLTGSLRLPNGVTCYPSFDSGDPERPILDARDGTLPLTVTLTLREQRLGLTRQVYYTKTSYNEQGGYSFAVRVPAGEYDVYLVPPVVQVGDCVVPPYYYRNFPIGVGDNIGSNGIAPFQLPTISTLNLVVHWPAGPTLENWTADIIEPFAGNSISTQVVLEKTPVVSGFTDYRVPLAFSKVAGSAGVDDSQTSGDLLRLTPPADLHAPTIYFDRTALGLLQTNPDDEVRLTAFTRFPNRISAHGQMKRQADHSSVSGSVSFISKEIYGVDPGIFASYRTSIDVEAGGLIDLFLPPGKYRVRGEPPLQTELDQDERLSATETTWEIAMDEPIQFGKPVELPPLPALSGRTDVAGAEVRALPSAPTASPFEAAFGETSFSPRAGSGLTDERGLFALSLDPGRFNVAVQAPEALGFGWLVRAGVQVEPRGQDLGPLRLPPPSVVSGVASLALKKGPAPLAWSAIRAYAYLNKDLAYTRDPQQAVSVIQVAETRADRNGAFRLLLPAGINTSK
jgi:hypothetical protein